VDRVRETQSLVGEADALEIARPLGEGDVLAVRPVIWPQGLEGIPAWEVQFYQPLPIAAWQVVIDRESGAVLSVKDKVMRADAPGRAWINPIVHSRNADLRDNLFGVDNAGPVGLGDDLSIYYQDVQLRDLESGPGGLILAGPHVKVMDATATGMEFKFPREDPRFEETNGYYWIDWSQRNIRELGFTEVANYQLPFFAHDQVTEFNAFYISGLPLPGLEPGRGQIHMGYHAPTALVIGVVLGGPVPTGFADAGEDAEVFLHEYGHAILDNQVPNFPSGAMHEGFGDIWAALQFSRVSNGTYDSCLGEWFTGYLMPIPTGKPPCLRDAENDMSYADYGDAEGHLSGQIWSGSLWNIHKTLGREATEKLVLEANFLLPLEDSFHAGAEALLMADGALSEAKNARVITGEFGRRNVTNLVVTPELLEKVKAADLAIASQGTEPVIGASRVPGPELVAVLGLLGVAALARRRR
jgi:hypothetical protein